MVVYVSLTSNAKNSVERKTMSQTSGEVRRETRVNVSDGAYETTVIESPAKMPLIEIDEAGISQPILTCPLGMSLVMTLITSFVCGYWLHLNGLDFRPLTICLITLTVCSMMMSVTLISRTWMVLTDEESALQRKRKEFTEYIKRLSSMKPEELLAPPIKTDQYLPIKKNVGNIADV